MKIPADAEISEAAKMMVIQDVKRLPVVDDDGNLIAQDLYLIGNTGPYGTHGYTVQAFSGLRGLTSYNAPNKRFDCDVAYTNIPVPGAYRGYGAPQAEFAWERHMDRIARTLGIDPLSLRRRNVLRPGDRLPTGQVMDESCSASAVRFHSSRSPQR